MSDVANWRERYRRKTTDPFAVCVTVLVNLYTDLATATNNRLNDIDARVTVLEQGQTQETKADD